MGVRSLLANTGEPFGLPRGTVRGVIALSFTAGTIFMWVTGQELPDAMLGVTTLIIGNYFGTRGSADSGPTPPVEPPLELPFVPGELKEPYLGK